MLYSTKELDGFALAALDGDIGHACEIYFDDERWVIRHVVADTGGWLSGRKVLISPHSIERIDREQRRMQVALERSRIENAPGIETDKPVSRQQESLFYDYYGYPYYWSGAGLWGVGAYPLATSALMTPPPNVVTPRELDELRAAERDAADQHLRSSDEVIGYHVEASDGSIGHIEDFLFDDASWQIRYAVVDTRNWLPGRLVLVSPESIDSVEWNTRRVLVRLSREAVKASPPYDRNVQLSGEDERRVQSHYEGWR